MLRCRCRLSGTAIPGRLRHRVSSSSAQSEPALSVPALRYVLGADEVHCLVGLNGAGKSRVLAHLAHPDAIAAAQATHSASASTRPTRVATLSFDEHRAFVARHGDAVVADVLGGVAAPAARDLIVRLGLFPVWDSHVRHLSTGELRKLMLAHALLRVPRATVLLMDQPFDGLDAAARGQLEWMLGQLTRGFTRLLVDTGGCNDSLAYKTQVVLAANRLEQVQPELLSHLVLVHKQPQEQQGVAPALQVINVENMSEDDVQTKVEAFLAAEAKNQRSPLTEKALMALVKALYGEVCAGKERANEHPALVLNSVSISYDRKRMLMENVNLRRLAHEHWVILGPNGSGKSSLMRVLTQAQGHGLVEGGVALFGNALQELGPITVEEISTDQHIKVVQRLLTADAQAVTANEVILEKALSAKTAAIATQLLQVDDQTVLSTPFLELSQGTQKLVLVAQAIARCPDILLLDEITHGLDPINREVVLRAINCIGKLNQERQEENSNAPHLIMITHHEDEIPECFQSVFAIQDRKLLLRGDTAA
ncbi:TPA: hypothetical protein N0F65_003515 [Lagenidium giganteum]|uniref:ABC transporter domain-containing protein n=1 Tax=Lagenidium giganteum TaxID=4803 RepID=A0AAV2Z2U6_9STRA|nr:TPA: hypothetical protein N0F65_003515 [Lagenidium giganteum]